MLLRPAADADVEAMVEAMFAEPGVEQVAFMPSLDGARRFTAATWRRAGLDDFTVAEEGGDIIGFAWCTDASVSLRDGARAAIAGWGLAGPIRVVVKGWPRQLVDIAMPEGAKLMELQVHPARRGRGTGDALLAHTIDAVGSRPISLTTRSDNPARHLYERHGFTVVAEKIHPAYERRTGSAGRILMVRSQ